MNKISIKKITAATAALVMCLSMISCGKNDESIVGAADKAPTNSASAYAGTEAVTTAETSVETTAGSAASTKTEAADAGKTADDAGETADYTEMFDIAETGGSRKTAMADGIAFGGEASPAEAIGELPTAPEERRVEKITDDDAKPFVLTAGEWKDNDNWGFFTNLIKSGKIEFPAFGLDPSRRIEVTVTKDGAPAMNQPVELVDGEGNVIWSAVTDKSGKAYVFYKKDQSPAMVRSGEASREVTKGSDDDQQGRAGTTEAALEVSDSKKLEDTQVMFILDTTGSMSDEIAYLQMDFSSIAKDVDDGHTTFSANFYRDEGDEYVTRCNPFTSDVQAVQTAINNEQADGGGDFPEAIAEILDETITQNEQWSDSANKIAFLIFDAPPHEGREQQLEAAVKAAAQKGIRLVPVISSGADRTTELFGRALAAQTGGSYVFLTDDSGVGGGHLEPIIGEYKVELLHDVIVRNITELRA